MISQTLLLTEVSIVWSAYRAAVDYGNLGGITAVPTIASMASGSEKSDSTAILDVVLAH